MIVFLVILLIISLIIQFYLPKLTINNIKLKVKTIDYLSEPNEDFEVVFTCENKSRLPVFFVKCACSMPPEIELSANQSGKLEHYTKMSEYTFTCFLKPKQKLVKHVYFKLPKRGLYKFSRLSASVGDFLGISSRGRDFIGTAEVVIIPKKCSFNDISFLTGGLMGEQTVRRWIHEDPLLSMGFREYTGREPQKAISWTRSLQSGTLMVKQFDHTTDRRAEILFLMNNGKIDESEKALSLCRTFCELLESEKIPYSLTHDGCLFSSIGKITQLESGLGSQHLNRVLEALGRAVYSEEQTDNSEIYIKMSQRNDESTAIVIITPELSDNIVALKNQLNRICHSNIKVLTAKECEPNEKA